MKHIKLQAGFQLAILRIGVAITILVKVIVEFKDLDMLFSQHGIIQGILSKPLQVKYTLSLPMVIEMLNIKNEHMFLSSLYIVFGLAGFSLLIGYKARISALICLLIHMMIFNGYNLLAFGFDGFLFSLLFYTLIFPVQKVYALDAVISGGNNVIAEKELKLYLLVMQVHLCIVYLVAGISKNGQEWVHGTAIWSAINQPQFYTVFTPFFKNLLATPGVSAAFTWGTLLIEGLFPVLIFIRYFHVNRLMLICVVLMHVFIGVVMGLQLFAWIMIVFDLSAFSSVFLKRKIAYEELELEKIISVDPQ